MKRATAEFLGTFWLVFGGCGRVVLTVLAVTCPLAAQKTTQTEGQELNLRSYIELLRSDIQTDKIAVVTKVMDFDAGDSAKFWPIYHDYEAELSKLGDQRLVLIKNYAQNYESLSDAKAHELALAAFDLESKRTELKRRYYIKLEQALSARTAARFFQVENQILMLLDLQVASMLPVVK